MSTPPNEPQSSTGDMFKKESEGGGTPGPETSGPQDAPAASAWQDPAAGGQSQESPGQWQDPGAGQWQQAPEPGQWQDPAAGQWQQGPGQPQDAPPTQYPGQPPAPSGYPAGGMYNYPPMGGQQQGGFPAGGGQGGYPYPQQPYGQPGIPGYGYPQQASTNGLAIGALVASLIGLVTCGVGAIVGIILGVIALNQIKQSGQQGRGMALAGIWVGVGVIALYVIYFVVAFAVAGTS